MINFLDKMFPKKKERKVRELLRENLNLIQIDMFYLDDPLVGLEKEKRTLYLKTFFDLYKDKALIDRLKYHINKQAQLTLNKSKDGIEDLAGAMNINGLAFVMNDIEKLSNMYIKEKNTPKQEPFDRFSIIPQMG